MEPIAIGDVLRFTVAVVNEMLAQARHSDPILVSTTPAPPHDHPDRAPGVYTFVRTTTTTQAHILRLVTHPSLVFAGRTASTAFRSQGLGRRVFRG
jgi:hypothetical protein